MRPLPAFVLEGKWLFFVRARVSVVRVSEDSCFNTDSQKTLAWCFPLPSRRAHTLRHARVLLSLNSCLRHLGCFTKPDRGLNTSMDQLQVVGVPQEGLEQVGKNCWYYWRKKKQLIFIFLADRSFLILLDSDINLVVFSDIPNCLLVN